MKLFWNILCTACLLNTASLFGFFFAWICSTMWGLDGADPRIAIAAMQAMNGSVRNGVFAVSFFGTPAILAITTLAAFAMQQRVAGLYFGLASLVALVGGLGLTMAINVPMNEALGQLDVPTTIEDARIIWQDYSPTWQFWNVTRTIAMGVAFVLALQGALTARPA